MTSRHIHFVNAAMLAGVGLAAFAAILLANVFVGREGPFMPGIVSAIFIAVWIFLLRRYGPRPQQPVDPWRRRVWITGTSAAAGALALFGLIAALLIQRSYSQPNPASSRLSFDARVQLAKDAEHKEEFKPYQSAISEQTGNHLAATMRSCFATLRDPATTTFTLVADITAEGKPSAIDVNPTTNVATCFAAGFAAIPFPLPPFYPDRPGFPITIEMHID